MSILIVDFRSIEKSLRLADARESEGKLVFRVEGSPASIDGTLLISGPEFLIP